MSSFDSYSEHQPVTWFRGYPVYASYLIVAIYSLSTIVTALFGMSGSAHLLTPLIFESNGVLRGEIWRFFTYGLVNQPSLWFVVDMYMLAIFGRELERFFGRKTFLRFFAALYLLSPVLFTLIGLGLGTPLSLAGETGSFAMFIAFATLYPNAVMLFNILAKWAAGVLVAIYALMALSERNLLSLISLLATTGFAFLFVRYAQGRIRLPSISRRSSPAAASSRFRAPGEASHRPVSAASIEVDALLDKIARSGLSSLTAEERAKLDATRDDLLKRSGRDRPS